MRRIVVAGLILAAACGCKRGSSNSERPGLRSASGAAVFDVHTHFGPSAVPRVLELMDRYGIDKVVNLSGRYSGGGLEQQLAAARGANGRIVVFANPRWELVRLGPGYGKMLARDLAHSHKLGARGLKISKGLGLGYGDTSGNRIAVDDPELDAMFDRAGQLGMPVAIHTGDPVAFWKPPDESNERYDELSVHPGWSNFGKPVPSWEQLFSELERRVARHPETIFISVHFGNAPEFPERVGALLDKYPNLYVDTAARIPEIGRYDPVKMRALFVRHKDRILFGTDLGVGTEPGDLMLGSTGADEPTQADADHFFSSSWRYFETGDKDFAHPTPIQGRWKISGIDLPADVLRAVYADNARRLLGEPPRTK